MKVTAQMASAQAGETPADRAWKHLQAGQAGHEVDVAPVPFGLRQPGRPA